LEVVELRSLEEIITVADNRLKHLDRSEELFTPSNLQEREKHEQSMTGLYVLT